MKRSGAIVAILFLITSATQGQEPASSIAPGARAVLFSFSGLGTLGAGVYEGGVGGKLFLSSSTAIRGGIQLSIAGRDVPANPPPGSSGTDGSVSGSQFGILAGIEYHLSQSQVSPYWGGGVGLSFTRTESKPPVIGVGGQTTIKNNRNGESIGGQTYFAGTTIRIFGLFGVEYFPMKDLSLAAEYRLGLLVSSRSDEELTSGNTTVTTKQGTTTTFGIGTGGALSLAVYF